MEVAIQSRYQPGGGVDDIDTFAFGVQLQN
jgi:hypothetical protein